MKRKFLVVFFYVELLYGEPSGVVCARTIRTAFEK